MQYGLALGWKHQATAFTRCDSPQISSPRVCCPSARQLTFLTRNLSLDQSSSTVLRVLAHAGARAPCPSPLCATLLSVSEAASLREAAQRLQGVISREEARNLFRLELAKALRIHELLQRCSWLLASPQHTRGTSTAVIASDSSFLFDGSHSAAPTDPAPAERHMKPPANGNNGMPAASQLAHASPPENAEAPREGLDATAGP